MEPSSAAREVLNEDGWVDGTPPERALIALFAAMTPEALGLFLRAMMLRALNQLDLQKTKDFTSIREVVSGTRRHQELDQRAWGFPGGDSLLDAVTAVEASGRLWRVALKSLSHAVEAAAFSVGAVIEHRDHHRDPAGWARDRKQIAESGLPDPTALSPERRTLRQRDRQEVWRLVLVKALEDQEPRR